MSIATDFPSASSEETEEIRSCTVPAVDDAAQIFGQNGVVARFHDRAQEKWMKVLS
jgi:hypothetical protein